MDDERHMARKRFSIHRVGVMLVITLAAGTAIFVWGRSLWRPIYTKMTGGATIADRLAAIEAGHPSLARETPAQRDLAIVCFKDERRIEIYVDRVFVTEYPMMGWSGTLGPKLAQGDRQIPEGVYGIDVLNPNSAYHLSMRVTYPNQRDLQRAQAAGVTDPGGDIYIHGRTMSIGCIAIGDDAIEELFYRVAKTGMDRTRVIIAPRDFRLQGPQPADGHELLYAEIAGALEPYPPRAVGQ